MNTANTMEVLSSANLLQMFGSLLLVVLLILALAWFLRRLQDQVGANATAIKLVGGLNLGGKEKVVLIEVAGKTLLVGVAPGSVMPIDLGVAAETVTTDLSPSQPTDSFRDKLLQATGALR